MTNEYKGGKIEKMLFNAKYGKAGAIADIESKIRNCFDSECDDCVKGNCEGRPLNIDEVK